MDQSQLFQFLFWTIALLTALCALATVVAQNIVRSATWLLFTLAGTSGIFFLLGADFVAAIQLLIYVGGTMVLVVFGVMLTAQGPFITMKTSGAEWAISMVAGVTLFAVLCFGTGSRYWGKDVAIKSRLTLEDPAHSHHSVAIGEALLGSGLGPKYKNVDSDRPERIYYLLPFEIVSVHLL